jgi:hypothetical protein
MPTKVYGPCEGGPYDGRRIAAHETKHRTAYERDRPWRAVPGMVACPKGWAVFGVYLFHPLTQKWHWFADELTAPNYELWIKEPPVPAAAGV